MSYKLYTYPNNSRAFKALVAAQYAGVTIEVPAFEMGKDNKTPEFLEKNPLGKVPTLETPEGSIWESNAIARYVARLGGNLYGSNAFEAGQIEQWIEFTRSVLELPASAWLYPIFGYAPYNEEATRKAKGDIRKALDLLHKHFATRTFLVGERITLADIVLACTVLDLYKTVLDTVFRKQFYNTNRWFLTVVNQPEFKKVVGDVVLCEKMAVAPEPEVVEEPEEEEEKPKKKKAAKKPAAEKKPAEKKPEPEAAAEDEEPKEKKEKNPLDLLPPSKLIMDEWKRTYSNTKDVNAYMQWFWEHYDAEGYCIYFCNYKYNEECTQLFKTLNQINGFMQRLEKLHKYAFGNLVIFGAEPKLEVSCCWLFRGTDLPADLTASDDFGLYEWVKADTNDEATKKLIQSYWSWEGEFPGGKTVTDGKVFK